MEQQKDIQQILDLNLHPAFCVREGMVSAVNQAAEGTLIFTGTPVSELLLTGEDYSGFHSGVLYLQLNPAIQSCCATVIPMGDWDLFVLEQDAQDDSLRAMALAARELRRPLSALMISADKLMEQISPDSPEELACSARMNRSLHQLLRIVSNMSDAGMPGPGQETRNLTALFAEIFEKAQSLVESTGITLCYQGPKEDIFALADADQLERALWNILSNAIKFSPKGSQINAMLVRRGKRVLLQVTDGGSGIAESIRATLFSRYLRQGAIEDSRFGLGLGMVLIRSAAIAHGGSVLVDQPEGAGTRITLSLALRQNQVGMLRSPVLRIDYAANRDRGLLELSDVLGDELYQSK